MQEYFDELKRKISDAYEIANKARSSGMDPDVNVESLPAGDLAARVEGLVGPVGIADRIRELSRENLSQIIDEILGDVSSLSRNEKEKRIEQAIRTSLAIITEGVVAAPIEGVSGIGINSNPDGSEYLSIYFAGPIRSAGGTAQGVTVVIGDYIRRRVGLQEYRPTNDELERYVEEIKIYNGRVSRLQYMPSDDHIREIVKNTAICVDGDPTEKREVSIHRDLKRVETNRIRGGMCLVIAEGIAQKARKVMQYALNLGLDWNWLSTAGKGTKEENSKEKQTTGFMSEVVGGRPIFSGPSAKGGFRLRYGRTRSSGIAAKSIHPATMVLLDDFIATGTQLKIEKPGKGCVITACDSIEGPIVKLKNGGVLRVESVEQAKTLRDEIDEILFLGDLLISYGDFLQTNTALLPAGYCEEWWIQEAKRVSDKIPLGIPTSSEAVQISKKYGIGLHPRYIYHWEDLTVKDLKELADWLFTGNIGSSVSSDPICVRKNLTNTYIDKANDRFVVKNNQNSKRILELLGVPHVVEDNSVVIEEYMPLLYPLGIYDGAVFNKDEFESKIKTLSDESNGFELIRITSPIRILPKVGTYIGARMGRPEKAKERKMEPAVHSLFPVGWSGGKERSVNMAAERNSVAVDIVRYECPKCKSVSIYSRCSICGGNTVMKRICPTCKRVSDSEICPVCRIPTRFYEHRDLDINALWKRAVENVGTANVKGVQGMISKYKIPEPLEKGILRARNNVFVFKDGTVRFDATNVPLTQFKPKEIGTSVERLKKLGYKSDYLGNELKDENQIVELKVQDVIIPVGAGDYLFRTSQFIDQLLEKFYGIAPYYKAMERNDLIGQLIIGLAPHTSAGITGRIIGFTRANVCYAHPFWHAAKRRNCLSPDTGILILNSGNPKIMNLENLYRSVNSSEKIVDDFGTRQKKVEGIKTFALNPKNGKFEIKRIRSVIKTPAPSHLVKIRSKSGRTFVSSPEHRALVWSDERVIYKKILELNNNDRFLVPEKINFNEQDMREIDLLKEFLRIDEVFRDVMVRGIRRVVERCVKELGGLNSTAQKIGVNKKTFSNYVYRDSIPLHILDSLLSLSNKDWKLIPRDCKLGVRRDHTAIPRIIRVDGNFMRLLGYYLSEGYARSVKKRHYQINLACMEKDMYKDIVKCIKGVFGIVPSRDKHITVIPNRLIYHLFVDILGIGKGARDKRIPLKFINLPKLKIKELLSAYFSGDGSVEKDRLHVTCSSVNEKLLRDIGLQLLRFGIFYRLKSEKKSAGGAAKEFYDKKEESPIFELHYISIRSTYAIKFSDEIGFSLRRKQKALERVCIKERKPRVTKFGDFILDEVKEITPIKSNSNFLYDIEVENHHNFMINDFVLSANCDGDEDAIILLLDTLINFSRKYLPENRGGQMDAPLVISTILDPKEIDDEAHKMEIVDHYPLEFYEKTWQHASPSDAGIMTVNSVLETNPYSAFGFTHDASDITGPVLESRYVSLTTMKEKVNAQLNVAEKIRAVDAKEVAELVINSHFLRDTYGNLRAFSRQKFRCVRCNAHYRRIPLSGKCTRCGGRLLLTVTEGSIKKYLDISLELCERYGISGYLRQRLLLLQRDIRSLFTNDLSKQVSISDYM